MRKIKPESSEEMYGKMEVPTKHVHYPSTHFDNKTLPEAKNWKVGKIYRVVLNLKMKGISQSTNSDGRERGNYDFDIVAIDPSGPIGEKQKRYED